MGRTTRQEAVSRLGTTTVLAGRRVLVYQWTTNRGGILMEGSGGGGTSRFGVRHYRVLLEFDERDRLKRYEVLTSHPDLLPANVDDRKEGGGAWMRSYAKELWAGRRIRSVAFAPDGSAVGAGDDRDEVWLWKLKSGEQRTVQVRRRPFLGARLDLSSVSFSPDGTVLAAAAADRTVYLLDVRSGRALVRIRGVGTERFAVTVWGTDFEDREGGHRVVTVSFAPDGRTVAVGRRKGEVKLLEVSTDRDLPAYRFGKEPMWSVAFSRDGQLLAASSEEGDVGIIDRSTGRARAWLRRKIASQLAFSPDGQLLASNNCVDLELWPVSAFAAADSTALLHSAPDTTATDPIAVFLLPFGPKPKGCRPAVAFSADGALVAATSDERVTVWEVGSGRLVATFGEAGVEINDMALRPDGQVLATAGQRGVDLWDVRR